jgi:hypothetical protein
MSAVFEAPSRVRLAHAHGLDCATTAYERAAGMHADIATVAAAHELGMSYSDAELHASTSLLLCSSCVRKAVP